MNKDEIAVLEVEISRRLQALESASTENIRAVRKEFSKILANTSGESVHRLALTLLEHSSAPRFFAYELVQHHRAASRSLNTRTVKRLGYGIQNWGDVDTFACYIAGPAWREMLVPDSMLISWAGSRDRWWRRAAVVSTVPLNNKTRGGAGDSKRTLMICELVVNERDDMVVKAVSWALRELAKRDPKAVKEFIAVHRSALSARVLREVTNKLNFGLKNPRQVRN